MLAGAPAGAAFVLLDSAVAPGGLKPQEIGLALNWRVGPLGYDFAGPAFAAATVAGGTRARRPLSPVHLAAAGQPDSSVEISWIRRGRIAADAGLAASIPLGEEQEAYRVEVTVEGGETVRSATVSQPFWIYTAADIASDFSALPVSIDITVRQLGTGGHPGDVATLHVTLN